MSSTVRLFISHSSKDGSIARQLVELIRHALPLGPTEIRCTSVNGYCLPAGSSTDEKLRSEAVTADAFIGLISANSIASTFVLFELGARWGSQRPFIPLLVPGFGATSLEGTLKQIHALDCGDRAQLHQMIRELCTQLEVGSHTADSFSHYIDVLAAGEFKSVTDRVGYQDGENTREAEQPDAVAYHDVIAAIESYKESGGRFQELRMSLDLLPRPLAFLQLHGLMGLFPEDSDKLQVLKLLVKRTQKLDTQQRSGILRMFKSDRDRVVASSYIVGY